MPTAAVVGRQPAGEWVGLARVARSTPAGVAHGAVGGQRGDGVAEARVVDRLPVAGCAGADGVPGLGVVPDVASAGAPVVGVGDILLDRGDEPGTRVAQGRRVGRGETGR